VNDLSFPMKWCKLADWVKKQDSTIYCLQKTHLTGKDMHRLKVKGWKVIYQASGNQKQEWVVTLVSEKIDFKPKLVKR
jgi:exonuclease III